MTTANNDTNDAEGQRVPEADIAEWDTALAAFVDASQPPSPDSALRDIYGNPAHLTYDEAMKRMLRVERAAFALVTKARACGHPHGALEHLRALLGVLLRNPMSNSDGNHLQRLLGLPANRTDGYRIDVVDLGLGNFGKEVTIAHLEVRAIEQRRAAERAIGIPDEAEVLAADSICQLIAKALARGPLNPDVLLRASKASEGTFKDRRNRMLAVGFLHQERDRMPYSLTAEGRKRFLQQPS